MFSFFVASHPSVFVYIFAASDWLLMIQQHSLCPKYTDIYELRWGRTWSAVHFLFIAQKNLKVQEHDLYLNQILHFYLNSFFLGLIIKILRKGGPEGPAPISLRSEYSSSN